MNRIIFRSVLGLMFAAIFSMSAFAQTTSEIAGVVTDQAGAVVAGANITAVHQPSGTRYTTVTNSDGRYTLPGLRIGGPYTITVTSTGFAEKKVEGINTSVGTTTTTDIDLSVSGASAEVTVTSDSTFSEVRTGAGTNVSGGVISTLPTIGRQLTDFSRLTPQYGGSGTFAGQDNRLNNITVDGSSFNNSFGLAGAPGERTAVSPISLAAVEEFQVAVAPYDVRRGNFVGAEVNVVTKAGTNKYAGSIYRLWRTPGLVGKTTTGNAFNPGDFQFRTWGGTIGGPLPFLKFGEGSGNPFTSGKDKMFFFFNYENEELTSPGTTFSACPNATGTGCRTGSTTRVLSSDLDALSNLLRTSFNYDPGPYQGYNFAVPGKKYLMRTDFNVNDANRLTFRYMRLDSSSDVLVSNSSSLGFGNRRAPANSGLDGLNFAGSNYSILENIRSIVGEWTSVWNNKLSNSLLIGYTTQDESRGDVGTLFPFVDILNGGTVYTSFGSEPFTPNNELRYNSFQLQENLTWYAGNHTLTAGLSYERYRSENVFFPGKQSAYVYNSLADFNTDAAGYLANPNRTTSPVTLRTFQVRYSNIPGLEKPIQPLKVNYFGFYGQDVWRLRDNFSLTFGIRADVPYFAPTGFVNAVSNAMTFRDENGTAVQYRTEKLPDANINWSPRAGFNWRPTERLQVRGGSGLFSGRPAYVWISNQVGNNGVLTGFDSITNATTRPFHPNPDRYKPTSVTGAPASTFNLELTDPGFKFPQLWRSTLGVDYRLPFWGLVAGTEFLYSKDVNGIYYTNDNLPAADGNFTGPDNRPRWFVDKCPTAGGLFTGVEANRINCAVTTAIVLKNQNIGKAYNIAATLEKSVSKGLYFKGAYSYGIGKNTVDPGSIATGTWQNNQIAGDPNRVGLGFNSASAKHRVFVASSYYLDWFKFGATTFSSFWESRIQGNYSYTFSGDLNGDSGTNNDLIYIPRDQSEMNFGNITTSAGVVTFTAAQQAAAWDAFINQDPYLSKNRGSYAVRGAAFLPWVHRMDFALSQDIKFKWGKQEHKFQLRADVLNFTNLLNDKWGSGWATVAAQPLLTTSTSGTATCRPGSAVATAASYCLRTIGGALLPASSFQRVPTINDVYRVQFGVKYMFN